MHLNYHDNTSAAVSTARVCLQYITSRYIVSIFVQVPGVYNMIQVIYIYAVKSEL